MYQFGICEWALPINGPYVFRLAREMGLDGVQIQQGEYERALPTSNPWIRNAYLSEAKNNSIVISSIAINSIDQHSITAPTSDPENEIVARCIREAVETAKFMHIPIVQIPSFFKSDIRTVRDFEVAGAHLRTACIAAQSEGIIIGSENALSVEENLNLIKFVNMPNLKIYFDTQNPQYMRDMSAPEMIRQLGAYICEVHVKDGKRGELSGSLLGHGDSDYYGSVQALKDAEYSGFIVLENYYDRAPMNDTHLDAISLLKQDIAIMKASFA